MNSDYQKKYNMMYVIKRDGNPQEVSFDKVLNRIKLLSYDLQIDIVEVAQKVCSRIYDKVHTTQLDELAAQLCSSLVSEHPDYGILSSRIIISNHHKNTEQSFSNIVNKLYNNYVDGKHNPLVNQKLYNTVMNNRDMIDMYIDYDRDFLLDYFGFKTLERSYLYKINKVVVERPQHMFMRVSLAIHKNDLLKALETYDFMSKKYFTHATPTLFNAGSPREQCSSCFLISLNGDGDSIEHIFDGIKECALISKFAGGIGIHLSNIRSNGSLIEGTNGYSSGIIPFLRVYNNTARAVNQCFAPDTLVYTSTGIKPIETIEIGDRVLTSDGSYKSVYNKISNPRNENIYRIKTPSSFKYVNVTKEHQIFALKNDENLSLNGLQELLSNKTKVPKYYYTEDLTEKDYLCFPVPNDEYNEALYGNDMYSDKFLRLYGIMVSCGKKVREVSENKVSYTITLNFRNYINIHDTLDFLKDYFLSENIIFYINRKNEEVEISFWNLKLLNDFNELFVTSKDKSINNQFMSMNKHKTQKLLYGILENKLYDNTDRDFISYNCVSEVLMKQIQLMFLKFGIVVNGVKRNKNFLIKLPKREELRSIIPNFYFKVEEYTDKDYIYDEHRKLLFYQIEDIDTEPYEGLVYDISVENNHNYVTEMGLVHNSGRRNGSIAIYLEPWHADIEQYLELRKNHGNEEERARDLFYAIWMPDLFMERVKNNEDWSLMCPNTCKGLADVYGEDFKKLYEKYENEGRYIKKVKAQTLWYKVLQAQIEQGMPYIGFKDHANRKSNQQNLGTIKSSNLCVAPETKVLTSEGYVQISELENKKVDIWNGKEFSSSLVKKTGENQKLIKVILSNGSEIECTKYHKFFIETSKRPADKSIPKKIDAIDLQKGMKLIRTEFPIINGEEELKYPYTQGIFAADGTYQKNNKDSKQCCFSKWNNTEFCKRHQNFTKIYNNDKCSSNSYQDLPVLFLYGKKKELNDNIEYRHKRENNNRIDLSLPLELESKYFVPINYSLKTKLSWLEGFVDGDGTIIKNKDGIKNIQVSSSNKKFLHDILLLLQTIGINVKISKMLDKEYRTLPNHKGGKEDYLCNDIYRFSIDNMSLQKLISLGFNPKRLDITIDKISTRINNRYITIENVIDTGRISDTYCFNEPKLNRGIFNGVITGNCIEIVEYSDENETAVCNLSSICLPSFIKEENNIKYYDFDLLHKVAKIIAKNIDNIIDMNFYPVKKAETSNLRHRPTGIGVQGLADTFAIMKYPYDSEEARELNKRIFETIYHGALEQSMETAKERYYAIISGQHNLLNEHEYHLLGSKFPGSYSSFEGSPMSKGLFQFDLWGHKQTNDRYDWDKLRNDIMKYGLRNSLLTSLMPTASTSQIMGFNESFEPFTSNFYKRKTLAGEFICVNKYLIADLVKLGLWNNDMKENIIINEGSVQHIDVIPKDIKELYKTSWDISQKAIIDLAADRGRYICQSQSMNLFLEEPSYQKLTSMHFYTWKKGLKTGIYYLRTKPRANPIMFSVDPTKINKREEKSDDSEEETCTMCSG